MNRENSLTGEYEPPKESTRELIKVRFDDECYWETELFCPSCGKKKVFSVERIVDEK